MEKLMQLPRPEHPRPQLTRADWINLNGEWTFEFDFGKSGMHPGREINNSRGFDRKIIVPFCPESKLSGVEYTDFIEAMWYHRTIEIPADWQGKKVLLHFGGVDYEAQLFIDGQSVGTHFGGSVSFTFDITRFVSAGQTHQLVLRVSDELRTGGQPGGKQCAEFKSRGCSYTRTTGIWQTVWLEAVNARGIENLHIVPDLDNSCFILTPRYFSVAQGMSLRATARDGAKTVAQVTRATGSGIPLIVPVENPKLWSPENPFLYDLLIEVLGPDGTVLDTVKSYAGMRKIHIEGNRILLNNQPIYLRLVLDQGFYPDGVWTAQSDEALKRDIELSIAAGFNGARLHQKVFEERFHYWADRLGYLTWGESASWGTNVNKLVDARNFLSEWREIVVRDRNHPSIIAWTPFNETSDCSNPAQHHRLHIDAYQLTKDLDPTRPVNDASGYIHVKTDLWTVHHYERPDELRQRLLPDTDDGVFHRQPECEAKYEGQPYLNDEFGGLKWIAPDKSKFADNTWGYGDDLKDEEEFYSLLEAEIDIMLEIEHLSGYCYTQLTDIEQEQNGIYYYDRSPKFDMDRIANLFRKIPKQK